MIKTTLIIPTLNRHKDLIKCLNSIAKLKVAFDEIIIIEQGDMNKTNDVLVDFKNLNISLYCLHVKSLTQARNMGVEKSKGEFVFFIDSDTELKQNYVEVALDYFSDHPKVVGITGEIEQGNKINDKHLSIWSFIKMCFGVILGAHSFKMRITRSGQYGRLFNQSKQQKVQWLHGGHVAYRQTVFAQGFRFNQDFIRWSSGEDVMFSYQVYKHYGDGSLMYLPEFRLAHNCSADTSLTNESVVKMRVIYRFIFWKKEVYQHSSFNLLCYLWGQLGLTVAIIRENKNKLATVRYLFKSYWYLAKNWRGIADNSVAYNTFILGKKNTKNIP
ncbi:Glycosyl transferase, family 2 [uncultured Candidatus Thioglobus sp.]|nr:Glycosyl transferase, family 2 [uncultured Candidatus Thioglobus sp.]